VDHEEELSPDEHVLKEQERSSLPGRLFFLASTLEPPVLEVVCVCLYTLDLDSRAKGARHDPGNQTAQVSAGPDGCRSFGSVAARSLGHLRAAYFDSNNDDGKGIGSV